MKLKQILNEILNEVSIEQLRTQYVDSGNMPSNVFDKVIDVTEKPAYATWLAKRVLTRAIKIEDIEKYEEYLDIFDRNKREYPSKDINFYKDKNKITDFISKSIEIKNKEKNDPSQQTGIPFEQKYSKLKLGTVADFDIYKIPQGSRDLYNTSCDLGSGTEWCTATGNTDNYFQDYIMRDNLYIIIDKKDKTNKYQFHYDEFQFMDKNDTPIFLNY